MVGVEPDIRFPKPGQSDEGHSGHGKPGVVVGKEGSVRHNNPYALLALAKRCAFKFIAVSHILAVAGLPAVTP